MRFYDQSTQQHIQPTANDLLQTIKAIETRYNGFHFRSRTEARWAVLFDALGIQYEYEKEGFDLICGPYLPDFWLPYPPEFNFSGYPGAGHWLEVKGQEPTPDELSALLHLSIATNHSGILVWGTPWNFQSYFTHRSGNHGWHGIPNGFDETERLGMCFHRFSINGNYSLAQEAINKAKSARFEFGEKG